MDSTYLPNLNKVVLRAKTASEGFMLAHLEAQGECKITQVGDGLVVAEVETNPSAVYDAFYGEEEDDDNT